jgi:hypothetical protein
MVVVVENNHEHMHTRFRGKRVMGGGGSKQHHPQKRAYVLRLMLTNTQACVDRTSIHSDRRSGCHVMTVKWTSQSRKLSDKKSTTTSVLIVQVKR